MSTEPAIDLKKEEYEGILDCVHCGLCISHCPTYRELGIEADSPRGRLYLMQAAADGRISLSNEFVEHMYLCLNCRNCEAVCPSGVQFGSLMEKTRSEIELKFHRPLIYRILRTLILRKLFPHSSRLRFILSLLRLYQYSGLQKIVSSNGFLKTLFGNLIELEKIIPRLPRKFFSPETEVIPSISEMRYRVGFFSGCIMSTVYGPVDEATVRVLTRNHCEVIVPKNQECCGAMHSHNGDLITTHELAIKNIEVFLKEDLDYIIVNSAGCGALLKEYSGLLKNSSNYSKKAEQFSGKVKDITEFLCEIDLNRDFGHVNMKLTYQDACHHVHVQGIDNQPRELINSIPGVEIVEMKDSTQCCGAAGIYNIINYDLSMKILDKKIINIKETDTSTIVTANPPCLIQMDLGNRRGKLGMKIMHIVELLDKSYAEKDSKPNQIYREIKPMIS